SHVATALNTPIPTNSSPASTHMNRSSRSQRSDTATDGSPGKAAGVRTAASTHTAASTATAACTHSSSARPPASNSGPPESTAARMPANSATLPTEIAAVRSRAGKYRAATLVIELSTNGWPGASTKRPGRAHPHGTGTPGPRQPPQPEEHGPAQPQQATAGGKNRPEAEGLPEPGVEPAAGGQRQDDVHEREDDGEITDRSRRHAHGLMG